MATKSAAAALDDVDCVLDGRVAGDDNREDARIPLERRVNHLPPVEAGQPQVRDDDVEGEALQLFERRLTRSRLDHLESFIGQALRHHDPERFLVVDQENIWLGISHLARLSKI